MLLSGEGGIGKSRLTGALMERLEGEPHTRLRYFCSPQHTDSALYPVIGQMERAAGLAHGDTAQVKLDKLDALLAQTSTSTQDAALLAEMLSLTNDGRFPAVELQPQQQRARRGADHDAGVSNDICSLTGIVLGELVSSAAARRGRRRAPLSHSTVLRPRGLDRDFRAARR